MLETDNYREIPLPQQSQEAPILHVQLLAGMDNKFNPHSVAHCTDDMAEILLALVSSKWLEITCVRAVL
jgi:hypothetical protein